MSLARLLGHQGGIRRMRLLIGLSAFVGPARRQTELRRQQVGHAHASERVADGIFGRPAE